MAEERRFELLCPEGAAVFETAGLPIAHLLRLESRLGIEPSRSGLQPDAWPIGLRLFGRPGGTRTHNKTRFERAASANSSHGPKLGAGGET